MCEEEIIKCIKDEVEDCKNIEKLYPGIENCELKEVKEYAQVLQGLLDLYQQEKEKNKELEYETLKRQWVKVDENGNIEPVFYISKDKLKSFFQDKITYRQFELQQEYKDFKDDVRLNILQDIKEEILGD